MTKPYWSWNKYKGNIEWLRSSTIYLARHGSHAYGTNIPTSDEDWRAVCIAPKKYQLGALHRFEQAESKDPDFVNFELKKFVHLASQCNPNVIEILFVDSQDVAECSSFGMELLKFRDAFITKRVRHTFSGYAASQMARINTHYRWLKNPVEKKPERSEFGLPDHTIIPSDQLKSFDAEIRKKIDSWSQSYLDGLDDASRIAVVNKFSEHLSEIGIANSEELWPAAARTLGASDNLIEAMKLERQYASAKRDYDNYQKWKVSRNKDRAELEAKYGYDCKHAMHLVRLLRMCDEILSGKGVIVKRPDADELKEIRNGSWTYEELREWAENEDKRMQALYSASTLPNAPDIEMIDNWLISMIEKTL